jgi:predicted aldo/keto reductase-like oxidoreductase
MWLVFKSDDFDKFLDSQLEKMGTETIDIYLFHALNAGSFEKIKKLNLIEKMEEAQKQGRIQHIGFSFHDTLPVFKEIIDFYDWDMAQIQYNYMDTGIQATTEGLKYAHGKGIAVVIMEPVKGGTLATPPAEAMAVIESAEIKRSPVDWALQFLWNKPEIATVLSGMSNQQMVDENCASAASSGINSLKPEEVAVINKLADIYHSKILVPCTACQYCMPCPNGVHIPKNFAILNNISLEESWMRRWQIKRSYKKLTGDPDKINEENPNGNASICIDCGDCLSKCPQDIDIPVQLAKVDAILGRGEPISKHFGKLS